MAYTNRQSYASASWVSALDTEINKREIEANVYDIWREDAFSDIASFGDRKVPLDKALVYKSWVNDQLLKPITVLNVFSSGTRTPTFTTTAATAGFVRVGDIIAFADGTFGHVQSMTSSSLSDTIQVKHPDSTGTITITGADVVYVVSYAGGERADAPVNKQFGYTKYSNKAQIFQEVDNVTDVENMIRLEASINGNDKYVVKSHLDKLKVLKAGINFAFIGGSMSTNNFTDATADLVDQNIVTGGGGGLGVQTTRGLNQYTITYGSTTSSSGISSSGVFALADLGSIADLLTAKRAPVDMAIFANRKARRIVDNHLKNLGSSGVTSARLVIDGREIDMQVDNLTYSGYNWSITTLGILDHPAFSSTDIGKSLHFVPYNNYAPLEGGGEAPALRTRYKPSEFPLGNEMIGEMQSGALAPQYPSGHINEWKTSWKSVQGFEALTPSFFARLKIFS